MQKIQKQNFITNKLNKNIKFSKVKNQITLNNNSDRPESRVLLSLPTKGEQIINNNERKCLPQV